MSQSEIEAERRRLAQILDAEIISSLELLQAQTKIYLDALGNNPQAQISLSVLQGLIQQSIQKARYVQTNLHPTVLETLGLEPALESFAADAKRVRGLTILLSIPRLRQRLPFEAEVILFRGLQLLIDSAVSLAHAAHFEVQLEQLEQTICLRYADNGDWYPSYLQSFIPLQSAFQNSSGHAQLSIQSDRTLEAKLELRINPTLSLTAREAEILQRVAEGMSNKEIASALHLSARTVNFHLDNVYSKLHVKTRTEAVMVALQQGWIENPVK